MKSWPKLKLGKVQVGSNIAQTKSKIILSYYLLQFAFIHPYLAPKYNLCPYLALCTYIYHYLPTCGCI